MKDQKDAYRTALREALADARQKADVIAQAMGGSVAGVLSVSEDNQGSPHADVRDGQGQRRRPTRRRRRSSRGRSNVSAGVTVVFAYGGLTNARLCGTLGMRLAG